MLALDEVVDHGHRAGAVERVQRGQVFEAVGLVAAQNVAHAGRFELEHAAGEALAEDLVGRRVVERQIFLDDLHAVALLDHLERVVDEREGGEPEEIHLEKRQLVKTVHVVLGDDFLVVGAVERNDVAQRFGRDHHARRMHR